MAMYFGLQGAPCITPMDASAYSSMSMGSATSYPNPPFRPPFCTVDNAHQQLHDHDHEYLNYHQQQLALFQQQQFAGCDVQSISPVQLAPWNHTVPPCVPWFQSNSPFPAETAPNCVGYTNNEQRLREFNLHCKRKGLHLDDSPTACKQYVSEEAMAFRMTQLNISGGGNASENRSPVETDWEKSYGSVYENVEDFELEQPEQQRTTTSPPSSVVVLAPELKKLETEPILPKSILEKIQKPSMELVLWKPPSGIVDEVIRATLSDANKKVKKAKGKEVQRTNECKMDEDV